jgi:ER protein Pkr1
LLKEQRAEASEGSNPLIATCKKTTTAGTRNVTIITAGTHVKVSAAGKNSRLALIMTSLFAEIMQPGGGVILIPFVRVVIALLLVLTIMGFLAGVARIHMVVLAFLSSGLLFSLSMFEKEFRRAQNRGGQHAPPTVPTQQGNSSSRQAKTD